ncbi:hypothetical protein ACIQGZ_20495 [Streptomyces sp. NPDC092296]|uniref:hypothetical protein n=1 Tax=Streptomyces sp. NPDC092296 TaxID=3366012 RepID=UPI00382ED2D6
MPDEDPAGDRVGLRLGDPGDPPQGRGEDFGRPGPPENRFDVPALTARNDRSQAHFQIHDVIPGCGTQQRRHVYDHLFCGGR